MLATDSDAFDAVGMMTCEHGPAFNKFIEAQTKYPNSGEQKETGWCIENDSSLPLFSFLASHPDRARRFGTGMRWFTKGEVWDLKHLTAAHDWKSLDRTDAVLVDVGGGQGGVAQVLAKQNKNLNIKVQDLHGTAEQGRKMLPSEFKGRIEFVGKDFIMEQPIKGADVYFFRWILHNWSDKYAILILQTLIPAMKDGTKVLVYEVVLSDKPEINWSEKHGL